ncbi:hypothetical protein MSG28_004750 [Choristoneura fumiferana]|uniref:Uncharacterized protein n=2 Tax=Choristoneura fumiferana TaxID=7141 RepID=A0ACC0K7F6_CHOFU|nr:hypothetical protein MSG28_004750 [Choristoneura fumiferana]
MERASRIQLQQHTNGAQPSVTGGVQGRPQGICDPLGATVDPRGPPDSSAQRTDSSSLKTTSPYKPSLKHGPTTSPVPKITRFQLGSYGQGCDRTTNV